MYLWLSIAFSALFGTNIYKMITILMLHISLCFFNLWRSCTWLKNVNKSLKRKESRVTFSALSLLSFFFLSSSDRKCVVMRARQHGRKGIDGVKFKKSAFTRTRTYFFIKKNQFLAFFLKKSAVLHMVFYFKKEDLNL